MTYSASKMDWIAIFVGSLDNPERVAVSANIHGQDALKAFVRPDPHVMMIGMGEQRLYVMDKGLSVDGEGVCSK